MDSSDEENFDIEDVSGSESEGYSPVAKKKIAKTAPASKATAKPKSKATTKPKAAPKKKVLADVDENAEESVEEVDEDDGAGPSAPRAAPVANGKKKSASETYTKLSQLEHVLKRPDSYIGSVETVTQNIWTYDSETKRMVLRDVRYVPGFFKIVDEILVNAADNKINDPTMDTLKVDIDVEEGAISVYNNGRGIPIEIHSKEKIYIPELIFGHLLSSSNYDDDEKKLTGGRNGYGAKLANIYSTEFTIDTADKNSSQKYKQTWTDNMGKCGKAKITKNGKGEEYTKVTFKPDLKRFGMETIDDDTVSLLKKRVYDMAGTVKDIKVFLNGERLKIKSFKQYVDMYVDSAAKEAAEHSGGAAQPRTPVIYERISDRWEVAFAVSDGTFQHVSFANSISTIKGGSHVQLIADQIAKNLIAAISKKNKAAAIKPGKIKEHMWIFVNAMIENPTFDSQTKEQMTLPSGKFGSKPALSEEFMKKVQKSSIVENVLNWAKFRADQQIKKTDGTKRNRLTGLPKLADANNAGTRNASKCTLILTEGDSAKALAVAGLGVVGRDNFGVFPLRGKLLNVREARHDQIMKNEEIQNIKKIMGLQHNKDYDSTTSLRYGQLMIMTDQDHDGSHIKGLLINFLDHFFPSLLKLPNFLVEFVTPIVRVTKGKQRIDFFTIPEYEQWLEETPDAHKWDSKYYKGLGTSKDSDARDYFSHMEKHMIPFGSTQDGDRELIELAFSKKKADDRKEWLRQFKPGTYLDHDTDEISYSDFINKELILFSMADNVRSIPSVADGMKPGQRKVIWACFKRKLKKEIKVAQLVGYISEHAAYHHGEQSLTMTIVNLAQDYVGSNNLNLLLPNGQYGTRDQGGKDHASARYIFTEPAPITRAIFHPADDPLLNYLKEDNDLIEPEYYMPVLPLILINGAEGIGTGWSTSLPSYNPADIVANIRRLMAGEEQVPMLPWWRGFKGTIKKTGEHKYDVTGFARKVNDTTIEITELPIHKWTQTYKVELEAMMGEKGEGVIKDYKEHHDNVNVHFVVNMAEKDVQKAEEQGLVEFFKLTGKINTSNMMCFDFDGKIKKYQSPEEIIEEFYPKRLAFYQQRKDYLANELQNQFEKLSNQARFIQMIVNKELVVSNRKKTDIVIELRKKNFRPFPKVAKAKAAGETEPAVDDPDAEEEDTGAASDFDYLLSMAIWSLTKEKIDKLLQQAADKEKELLALLELTPNQIWNTDLDNFMVEWEKHCKEWDEKGVVDANGKRVKRKQATLQTRKSLTGPGRRKGDDESDDDFKPTKAAVSKPKKSAAAPAATKPRAKPTAVKAEESEDDDPPSAPPPVKRAAAKKPPPKEESDSDIEMVDDKPAPPPKKAPPKKAVKKVESDDDSADDVVAAAIAKGKGKAREPQGKRKSPEVEEPDSDESAYIKPAKKTKVAKQAEVTDFFGKPSGPSKPTARKVSNTTKAPAKKVAAKKVVSSDDEMLVDDPATPPPRAAAPKRAARGAAAKAYIELSDDDDDDE
ncbi:type II DNA topoisomerase [Artomyces pyxidatus]|uniref:Type II DNA topoisomerase n=1 Tax=Artomyces pyxidatus TaxID=48021 RepID=A0ACB8SK05_9AGAM|nr:type II DNA topoisomerase [Artomyces pyxidatus]